MMSVRSRRARSLIPALQWRSKVNANTIQADAYAGLTNAAIVLPQGVAFAIIAGLPPEYGLYTAMITAVVAAIFGSSMIMISGPTTAISAIVFASLANLAVPGTPEFIELALVLTVMVGLVQVIGGLAKLGALVSFVSHSVMTAFTAAAAVLIAVSQLAGTLGVKVERGGSVLERVLRVSEHIQEVNYYAVIIALGTLLAAIVMKKLAPKLPGLLFALVFGVGLSQFLDASSHGVEVVGKLPSLIPAFHVPRASISDITNLASSAVAIALVGLLEAISIGRSFAIRRKELFSANQEMIGQGLSNVVGGFFQCYAGSGSFTRSGINHAAGAVTPLSAIFASAFLGVTLLFIGPIVSIIPMPALAGLILIVAWQLIDFEELKHVITSRSPETVILGVTLAVGLMVELDFAIYIGVIASLLVFIYESSKPEIVENAPMLLPGGDRKFRDIKAYDLKPCPQIITLSLEGPLYFGSVERIEQKLKKIRADRLKNVNVVLALKGIGKIDLAAADLLISLIRDVKENGGKLKIIAQFQPLIKSLKKFHVIDELGEENLHLSKAGAIQGAMKSFRQETCAQCKLNIFRECDDLRMKAAAE